MSRQALVAKVHIAKKELGMDGVAYRAFLERVTGKNSAGRMTLPELDKVMQEFRSLGWKPKMRKARRHIKKSPVPLIRKVYALWGDMCTEGYVDQPDRDGLRAFVKRMTGVEDPEWMDEPGARIVVEALKSWKSRMEATQ